MRLFINLFVHAAAHLLPDVAAMQEPVKKLLCAEPDYAGIIPPMQLRRMSKVVRMGIAAARLCLQKSGVETPDAISIGTAYGCLQDTEVFLSKMVAQDEQMLTPTAFIQSTHNTVAGQIALLLKTHGHNFTYSHRGHSLEHAVLDATLYLAQDQGERMAQPGSTDIPQSVLVGGIDELTDTSLAVLQATAVATQEAVLPANLLNTYQDGALTGEGAAFFLLKKEPAGSSICIRSIELFFEKDPEAAAAKVLDAYDNAGLLLLGDSGDQRYRPFYDALREAYGAIPTGYFKPQSGEYPTAAGIGLSLLAAAVADGDFSRLMPSEPLGDWRGRVLLVNQHAQYYAVWELEVI